MTRQVSTRFNILFLIHLSGFRFLIEPMYNFSLQIYDHLNRFDASCDKLSDPNPSSQLKVDNDDRVARTPEDMQEEAKSLRQHFEG
jgi:hypothetical protein